MRPELSLLLLVLLSACGSEVSVPAAGEAHLAPAAQAFGFGTVNGCSGALFALEGMPHSERALVITNGHCVGLRGLTGADLDYPAPGEVVTNIDGPAVAAETNITLHSSPGPARVQATRLLYATMTGTDVGVFELEETFEEISAAYGIEPIVLERAIASMTAPVVVRSGFYDREIACSLAGSVILAEGPYRTTEGVRFTRECRIYVGVSGSPIMTSPGRFVGLANTHNAGSGAPCSLHNPCEVEPVTGATSSGAVGQAYGVFATRLYDVLDVPAAHH